MEKTEKVKKKHSEEKHVEKSEKGTLGDAMVRISAENAEYVKMHTGDGWYVASGKPRVPELNKDIRLLISTAVRHGCALFATSGGMRVMKNANGEGGVFFVEFKNMSTGGQVFLFSSGDAFDKAALEKAGLVVTREGKGFYVAPKLKNGDLIYEVVKEKFSNNHPPQGFTVHPWQGYEVHEQKKKAAKAAKKDKVTKVVKKAAPEPVKEEKVVVKKKIVEKEITASPVKPVKKLNKKLPAEIALAG